MQRCILSFFILLYIVLSVNVMIAGAPFFIKSYNGIAHMYKDGVPKRPLAYRILMPSVTHLVQAAVPDEVKQAMTPQLIAWRNTQAVQDIVGFRLYDIPWRLRDGRLADVAIEYALVYLTVLAAIAMLYHCARVIIPESRAPALLAPCLLLIITSLHARWFFYTYDFLDVFFSATLLTLLFRGKWTLYLITLGLATFNRETSAFMILVFAAHYFRRLPWQTYMQLLLCQMLVWFIIKAGLHEYFIHRPGDIIWSFYHQYIAYLLGFRLETILKFFLCVALICYDWERKPLILRWGCIMVAANLVVCLHACYPTEWRTYYFSLPPLLLLIAHTLASITGFNRICNKKGA